MNNNGLSLNRQLLFFFVAYGLIASAISWGFLALEYSLFLAFAVNILLGIGLYYLSGRRIKVFLDDLVSFKRDLRKITDVVSELALESQYLRGASTEQSDSIQRSAASVEETSSMAEQTAHQANESSKIVGQIDLTSQEGVRIMKELNESINSINEIRTQIEQVRMIIEQVTEKTMVIDEIVFNTRLLSFNASIEAERAGAQGAGFAVVAQEIGKLANHSGNAAREIREILKDSSETVKTIVQSTGDKVTRGIDVTTRATNNFDKIAKSITTVAKNIEGISAATREQNIGIKQISEAMSRMDSASQENVKVAKSTETLTVRTEEALSDLDLSVRQLGGALHCKFEERMKIFPASDEMVFIAWDDIYSVGLKTIDDQHIVLIDIINKLYRAIRGGKTENSLKDIFDELMKYVDWHFSFENDLFHRHQYRLEDEHIALHKSLVNAAINMRERFLRHELSARELMDFLRNWLMNHIMKEDVKYVPTLKQAGVE